MLVVILGAGASYDSSPRQVPPINVTGLDGIERHRLPLTPDLFNPQRDQYHLLGRYGPATAVVRRIERRLATEKNLERILGDLQAEAEGYPQVKLQLLAIKFYLRDFLAECTRDWWDDHDSITSYAEFVDQINRYGYQNAEQICYISFNYDTLLDRTLVANNLRDLSTIDGYVAPNGPWYIKVHGSVNWKRVTASETPNGMLTTTEAMRITYEAGTQDTLDRYIVNEDESVWSMQVEAGKMNRVLLPAIAIPVERKTESHFEMPEDHKGLMIDALRRATRILIVGWRGSEEHFNEILRSNNQGLNVPISVVCGEGHAGETIENLSRLGFANIRDASCGFNHFVENGPLIDFLENRT